MTGTRMAALAANSPKARILRTMEERSGTTNPRLTMCWAAIAAAAASAASWGLRPAGEMGQILERGSASPAASMKTARQDGFLHEGLKTLGVQVLPSASLIEPPVSPPPFG